MKCVWCDTAVEYTISNLCESCAVEQMYGVF